MERKLFSKRYINRSALAVLRNESRGSTRYLVISERSPTRKSESSCGCRGALGRLAETTSWRSTPWKSKHLRVGASHLILQPRRRRCTRKVATSSRLAQGGRSPGYQPTHHPSDQRGGQDARLGNANHPPPKTWRQLMPVGSSEMPLFREPRKEGNA